jgi:hypothetical protein
MAVVAGVTFVQDLCPEYLALNFVGTIYCIAAICMCDTFPCDVWFLFICSCTTPCSSYIITVAWTVQALVISRRPFDKIPYDLFCSTIECPHLTVERFVASFRIVIPKLDCYGYDSPLWRKIICCPGPVKNNCAKQFYIGFHKIWNPVTDQIPTQ